MKPPLVTPRNVLCLIGALSILGVAFAIWLGNTFAGFPDPRSWYNAFYVVFARDEVWGLTLVALFSFLAAFFLFTAAPAEATATLATSRQTNRLLLPLIAVLVFVVAGLGSEFVCHNYALSADEFMADFQAQIFLRGKISAEIPPQWLPALRVIKPTYADYLPQTHSWKATYLPVYAVLRALFQSVDLQAFLNPALAALTILALFGAGRAIWPNEKQSALVAVLLLAASAQFLVMAMTSYAMPAHLAFNTVWLWLYARPDRRRFYLAPIVGVLAIGLHQPIVHALFVAPFFVRLVVQRKWKAVSVYGSIYLAGCAGWYAWRSHFAAPGDDPGSLFRLFNPKMIVIQPMDLLLVIGWSCLATPLLAVLGLRRIFRELPIVQDAALSCLCTFGFYYFFLSDQGHGWGYRYFHGTLSCLILVAVAGWHSLGEKVGRTQARRFLRAGVVASLVFVLPLRCYQAESFIRPFARAAARIHSLKAKVVGLNVLGTWYAADLIRNDPFLETAPVVAVFVPHWIDATEVRTLQRAGKGILVTRQDLGRLGLATISDENYLDDPFHLGEGP